MPKLLDREPTLEMIDAGREALNLAKRISADEIPLVFSYMYDAAPEMKQEPVGEMTGHHPVGAGEMPTILWRDGYWPVIGTKLYTFPPDAQAEIAKRDARIKDLEADQDKANAAVAIGNYLGKTYNYAWCDTSLASQTIDLLKEQSAEIARLKGVLAKCKETINGMHEWFEAEENHAGTTFYERVEMCRVVQTNTAEALAAIKEEGL